MRVSLVVAAIGGVFTSKMADPHIFADGLGMLAERCLTVWPFE